MIPVRLWLDQGELATLYHVVLIGDHWTLQVANLLVEPVTLYHVVLTFTEGRSRPPRRALPGGQVMLVAERPVREVQMVQAAARLLDARIPAAAVEAAHHSGGRPNMMLLVGEVVHHCGDLGNGAAVAVLQGGRLNILAEAAKPRMHTLSRRVSHSKWLPSNKTLNMW
jgi:hypothetical protein